MVKWYVFIEHRLIGETTAEAQTFQVYDTSASVEAPDILAAQALVIAAGMRAGHEVINVRAYPSEQITDAVAAAQRKEIV